MDTIRGAVAYTALVGGLVAALLLAGVGTNLIAHLFGDILVVNRTDLSVI